MAEGSGLLNRRRGQTLPRVRIPVSPHFMFACIDVHLNRDIGGFGPNKNTKSLSFQCSILRS